MLWGCNAERGGNGPVGSVQPLRAGAPSRAEASPEPPQAEPVPAAPARRKALEGSPSPRAELWPGANEEFDDDALADLDEALSAVEENAFATLVRTTRDELGQRLEKSVRPDNCRSWRTLRTSGYAPKSNVLAKQMDAGALVRCGGLEFLARAKPSRVSHVRNILAGASPSSLPAIVASATSKPAQRSRSVAASRGLSVAELLPDAHSGQSDLPGRVSIIEPASATSVILNAEAWGDVNSDETEDVLLSVMSTSDDGTYFEMRLIEVTRASAAAPWTVLAVSR
jgi:hypothetical protein